MTGDRGDAPGGGDGADARDARTRPPCDEPGCDRRAAVRLHVPRADDRAVCPPHARVLARPDGVVAEPMAGAEDEWP